MSECSCTGKNRREEIKITRKERKRVLRFEYTHKGRESRLNFVSWET